MIPLKTLPNAPRRPYWTWLLALVCLLAFIGQQGAWYLARIDVASSLGVVPRRLLSPALWASTWNYVGTPGGVRLLEPPLFSPVYALFLHADIWHLGFNLLFLLVFGAALESELGRTRFLVCYFWGGFVAALAHIAFHLGSAVPAIGASGAIAALLGAYLVRLPRAWVLTYFPPIFLFPVPAPLFLLVWIGGQVAGAWHAGGWMSAPSGSEIAWMAHVGGFAFGACYGFVTRPRRKGVGARRKTSVKTSRALEAN
jgi:membrane associated rhomboid family serine protease